MSTEPTVTAREDFPMEITRDELYELVWSIPIRRLASQFGMSDVGIAKACARLDVPRPTRGHWQRIEAGHRLKPSPLPVPSKTTPKSITLGASRANVSVGVANVMTAAAEAESSPEREITIRHDLRGACALVRERLRIYGALRSTPMASWYQGEEVSSMSVWGKRTSTAG